MMTKTDSGTERNWIRDRDDEDDEKWTFKQGRWEKNGGAIIWKDHQWVDLPSSDNGDAVVQSNLSRYRAAMKIATSRADASGKGKDVLGSSSPWKLNLYDDDLDGRWDRAKLDTNRDEVDDEKWNFKDGRWEKNDGRVVWEKNYWTDASPLDSSQSSVTPDLARYRAAMKIATSPADSSGKGKDVLGSSSPWKLNLYDDNKDGQWDRAKLDKDRDEVDDEKWNFKNGRWEKASGESIWMDGSWKTSD